MMKRLFFIEGGVILLLSIFVSAFFVAPLSASAHSAGDTPTPNSPITNTPVADLSCQHYLQTLARRLNIPLSTFARDTLAQREDALARMVKNGKLTRSQADALKQRLISHQVCSGKDKNWRNQNVLNTTLQKYQAILVSLIAQGLHTDPTQLQTRLQKGQTLTEISKGQNISENQLSMLVLNSVRGTLDQAQKAGDLTSQQASSLLQYLRQNPDTVKFWMHHVFTQKQPIA